MNHELTPEKPRRSVNDQLAEAGEKLPRRLTPEEAYLEIDSGEAKIIDIRYSEQRLADGDIPGAILINRNEFEWRCDPASEWRDENIIPFDYDQRLIIICNQGFQS